MTADTRPELPKIPEGMAPASATATNQRMQDWVLALRGRFSKQAAPIVPDIEADPQEKKDDALK